MQWLVDSPAAPAALALAALALVAWGWRGVRVNDHPICRGCGFDLFGRPPDSTHCSECGRDLRGRRAVREGARRRVRRAIAVGLFLLLPSLGMLAFHGYSATGTVPLAQRKPLWWLLNDAASADPALRDDAFNEIFSRFRRGRLSAAQVHGVTERALAVQGDARKAWLPPWGNFVEEAYRAGGVTAEQWRRYVKQAPHFELVAPEKFRRGDAAWLELVERPSRVGDKQDLVLRVHRKLEVTDGRGTTIRRDFGAVSYQVGGSSPVLGGWSLPLNEGVIGRLADGRHAARLEVVVEVHPLGRTRHRSADPAPVATVPLELRTAWVVEPAKAPADGVAVNRP